MGEDGSVIRKNHLTLLHLNVRSRLAKRDELLQFLQESHTDVATLNETFLTDRHRLYFPGYSSGRTTLITQGELQY